MRFISLKSEKSNRVQRNGSESPALARAGKRNLTKVLKIGSEVKECCLLCQKEIKRERKRAKLEEEVSSVGRLLAGECNQTSQVYMQGKVTATHRKFGEAF